MIWASSPVRGTVLQLRVVPAINLPLLGAVVRGSCSNVWHSRYSQCSVYTIFGLLGLQTVRSIETSFERRCPCVLCQYHGSCPFADVEPMDPPTMNVCEAIAVIYSRAPLNDRSFVVATERRRDIGIRN